MLLYRRFPARFYQPVKLPRQSIIRQRPSHRRQATEDLSSFSLFDLQAKLEAAVGQEDYTTAAKLRDVISEKELDVELAVEYANRRFYEAFQNGSLTEMQTVWSEEDHVQCVHPYQGCIASYELVMESWKQVLSAVVKGSFRIDLADVRIHVSDEMASVTCVELVTSGRDTGRILATNIYELRYGEWKMILHHGSPHQQF